MFEDPRFENGTKSFISELKKLTDAGVQVYVGGVEGERLSKSMGNLTGSPIVLRQVEPF